VEPMHTVTALHTLFSALTSSAIVTHILHKTSRMT